MSKKDVTRDNHYVPIWHQKGFMAAGQKKLHYLNLSPDEIPLPDGSIRHHNAIFYNYPSQCFYLTDLYSTLFGTSVNDEIERRLFGEIDTRGAPAVKAFIGEDQSAWTRHFEDLFLYLDAQKIRTPKGLDWIRSRYAGLDQNALMMEMQALRTINCTIWSEAVREIVSAKNANVGFLLTDHPVTVYNYACPPEHTLCAYPADPSIALKASQTIFPLDQDHCLILTNLEYAEEPEKTDPMEKRTYARPLRTSLVRTDTFIRQRELRDDEVTAINYVLKSRARRFLAAGERAWLWPEKHFDGRWKDVRAFLLPPSDGLWHYGGEIFAGFEDGSVLYQDAYGRPSRTSDHLKKSVKESDLGVNDPCGCGSGRKYKKCCKGKPEKLRPTWKELSVRERNIAFFKGINSIIGTDSGKDWDDVRRELNEEKVKRIHELYGALWPVETDLFDLLPKPDGKTRALYSGLLDPRTAPFVLSNACLYFGDILVQSPFINPNQVNKEYSPVENPHCYLAQTLKNLSFLFQIFPWIESGHVQLFPDPASIDVYLQRYSMELAVGRSEGVKVSARDKEIFDRLQKDDFNQVLCMLPEETQERMIRRADPDAPEEYIEYFLAHLAATRESNPLVLLREGVFDGGEKGGGQLSTVQVAPNFELLLLIGQATGSFIVTDSHHRWEELKAAGHRNGGIATSRIKKIEATVSSAELPLCDDLELAYRLLSEGKTMPHRKLMGDLNVLLFDRAAKLHEDAILSGFAKAAASAINEFSGRANENVSVKMHFTAPTGGIYHNHIQRLMVRCGIDDRPPSVHLAVLMDIQDG